MTRSKIVGVNINTNVIQPQLQNINVSSSTTYTKNLSLVRDLYVGSVGNDVIALQKFLNSNGYIVAVSGLGSVGNESTYFGSLTQQALSKWQAANSLPATGYLETSSRNIINKLLTK